ncbi:hypothetical protein AVEN_117775-1 [Araneus ventricosus]|uniref:Jerky-like n=1 Tax=Araneus ventricosus TaxID=182803 RepID=A0A4Y2B7Z2_ARAVE|nr:hypothetical protein AVEN_117775-1 [Araneus ventricosus]
MKRRYRKQLLSKLPFEGDDDEEEAACSVVQFWKAGVLSPKCRPINNDSGFVTVTELNELLEQFPGRGKCEEDDVSSWLDWDADNAGFQLMSDDEIIAQVRKSNSHDDNSESDEDEVIETSKISNSYSFECSAKGLMWLEQQTDSDSTELMLLKQVRDRAAERRQS